MRILLIEDDVELAEVVALGLRNESYVVDVAGRRDDAEALLRTTDYDVACLDLGLPDGDGLDLLRGLAAATESGTTTRTGTGTTTRTGTGTGTEAGTGTGTEAGTTTGTGAGTEAGTGAGTEAGTGTTAGTGAGAASRSGVGGLRRPGSVLVLTARDAVADRVAGLDAGADDYLVKPFDFAELVARLRALARRGTPAAGGGAILRVGDLTLDQARHKAWRADAPLDLTPREFALLRFFLHHPGEVLSAETLLEHVWDANADPFTTSVRVILSRLRRKLGSPTPISTIPGVGYRLEVL